jgi:FMN-dependent NADH-azoreductase
MSLFRLDASIREEGSHSRAIADIVEKAWRENHPDTEVTRRSVGINPLPSTLWAQAVSASWTPEDDPSPEQRDAAAVAASLGDELLQADALLFAIPLYNFGVSQHFKAWVDVVLTDKRLTTPDGPALAGRPAVLVIVRGGAYGVGTPREGWDHASGWYRRILEDVWQLDVKVVEKEFTLVGVNPALDEFKDLAAQMGRDAEALALEQGRHLATVSAS